MTGDHSGDMEELANMLAYRLPLVNRRDRRRETCIRLKAPLGGGISAELVVRKHFVRLNLSAHPEPEVLQVSRLEAKELDDDRFAWAAEVRPENGLGARLLLEAATSSDLRS
jgi:hypothetical protein